MENNQHSSGQSGTPGSSSNTFSNQQPGQQLPAGAAKDENNNAQASTNEQHSESSKPENENETLGTP